MGDEPLTNYPPVVVCDLGSIVHLVDGSPQVAFVQALNKMVLGPVTCGLLHGFQWRCRVAFTGWFMWGLQVA